MHLEQMMDRRFFGYRSPLGCFRWMKNVKKNLLWKGASVSDRLWCIRHGFTVSSFNLYGHENLKKNYRDYLSERQYLKMHPFNGAFSVWIDDKLTMKYVFSQYDEYLPAYYFHIENGEALRLANCPDTVTAKGFDGILQLLGEKKALAAKQLWGSCGDGFYRLEYTGGEYLITGKKASREDVVRLLSALDHYIITEFIRNHTDISSIWPDATNTVRMMMAVVDGEPVLMRSFIRFGNARSNGVDNAHAGGIEAIIDEETGKILFAVSLDAQNYATRIETHPDSGASFQIRIPHWQLLEEKCREICLHYPELRYWGFDIAVTQDSFKILEINSLSGLMAAQLKEPMLRDPKTRRVYQSFGLKP